MTDEWAGKRLSVMGELSDDLNPDLRIRETNHQIAELKALWQKHRWFGLNAMVHGSTFIVTREDVVFNFLEVAGRQWEVHANGFMIEVLKLPRESHRDSRKTPWRKARKAVKCPPSP